MFLRGLFLFHLFIFCQALGAVTVSESYPELVYLIQPELLQTEKSGVQFKKTYLATGFFISQDTILTAAHFVNNGYPIYFKADDETYIRTKIVGINEKYDLALLRAIDYETEDFYSLGNLDDTITKDLLSSNFYKAKGELDSDTARLKKSVVIPGFPNDSFNIIEGKINHNKNFKSYVNVTDMIDPIEGDFGGLSGSPVLSKSRELIGIVIVHQRKGKILSYFMGLFKDDIPTSLYDYSSLHDDYIGFVPLEIVRQFVRTTIDKKLQIEEDNSI